MAEEPHEVYARLKPAADAATAQREAWFAGHLLPGDDTGTARRRYTALRLTASRKALSAAVASLRQSKTEQAAAGAVRPMATRKEDRVSSAPFADDGQDDGLWALDHSMRKYRVRPVRPEDDAWFATGEAIAVFDTATLERLVIPSGLLGHRPRDDDQFGRDVFGARDVWNKAHGL
ncbi:hypothetical protein [Brevundimonas sp.]|uniref:hypothetical protein n=1 Tax=Brevundimonas sp. TaxID=1871086 RepID=UPI003BAD8E44